MINKNYFQKMVQSRSSFWPYITLITILFLFLIYSFFSPIPTENKTGFIGIGSNALNIGDRSFYLYDYLKESNEVNIRPSFLYPFILQCINNLVSLFGLNEFSKLWNFLVITLSCVLSFFSLYLIDDIAWELFGKKVAILSCWIYIICPYTIFFAISGSMTHYVLLGTNLSFWIVLKSKIFYKRKVENNKKNIFKYLLMLGFCCFYLSSLRPSGAIYSITFISFSLIFLIYKYRPIGYKLMISYTFLVSILFYGLYQLHLTSAYIDFALEIFKNEPGYFFGVKREILRQRILVEPSFNLDFLKNFAFNIMWKTSDFFSGINDIRDTHTEFNQSLNQPPLFPFLIRVFSGLFYFAPVNIVSLLGIIKFRRIICSSGIWILLICILVTLSPSLLGVASNRYLYMLFTPFIIFSASIFSEIFIFQKNK